MTHPFRTVAALVGLAIVVPVVAVGLVVELTPRHGRSIHRGRHSE